MSRPSFRPVHQPGLQPQRTSLAWNRTALAGLGLLGAVVKVAGDHADALTLTCSAIVVVHCGLIAACAIVRARFVAAAPPHRIFRVAYASTVVAGLAATASIVPSL